MCLQEKMESGIAYNQGDECNPEICMPTCRIYSYMKPGIYKRHYTKKTEKSPKCGEVLTINIQQQEKYHKNP